MRYYRHASSDGPRLVALNGGQGYDLTSVHDDLHWISDLLSVVKLTGDALDDVVEPLTEAADQVEPARLEGEAILPIVPDEVWAAGVTYEISEKAREEESVLPEVYRDVYEAERPEIFFKATPSRTVGPNDAIGIREDSTWNVPEPELGVVLFDGQTVGYTIGNDVSSREIEGENPLYLPQAKVYDRCCALGPCFVSAASIRDPHDLEMSMEILRNGTVIWEDATSTSELVRTCDELVSYYRRSNVLPRLAVLLTGTSLVPSEETTLQPDDVVRIEMESIGTLENHVVTV